QAVVLRIPPDGRHLRRQRQILFSLVGRTDTRVADRFRRASSTLTIRLFHRAAPRILPAHPPPAPATSPVPKKTRPLAHLGYSSSAALPRHDAARRATATAAPHPRQWAILETQP